MSITIRFEWARDKLALNDGYAREAGMWTIDA